jgi:hypothetical protein
MVEKEGGDGGERSDDGGIAGAIKGSWRLVVVVSCLGACEEQIFYSTFALTRSFPKKALPTWQFFIHSTTPMTEAAAVLRVGRSAG